MKKRIALAADHGGYLLKKTITDFLKTKGFEVLDLGTYNEEPVDYPDYAVSLANAIKSEEAELGILVCGSGVGAAIAANKIPDIRAGLCHDTYSARLSREHNDINVLCLGARVIGPYLALDVITAWLSTDFSLEERHVRRLNKIKELEKHL